MSATYALSRHMRFEVLRFPRAAEIVTFVNLYREAVEEQSPEAVRTIVTRELLGPHEPDRLLELFVGFQMIAELERAGFNNAAASYPRARSQPFGRLFRGIETVTVWYQRPLATLLDDGGEGQYRETLAAAGLAKGSLRPDFVMIRDPSRDVLLVEVKFSAEKTRLQTASALEMPSCTCTTRSVLLQISQSRGP